MTRRLMPMLLHKELRALLPIWLAAVLIVGAGALAGGMLAGPGLAAFAIGVVVLGAQAVGHEHTHGTLGWLLAQPVDRRRIFAAKMAALALLLIPLTWIAWQLVVRHLRMLGAWASLDPLMLVTLAALALFVSPALTMAARGVLPGAVFTLMVPVVLLLAGDLAGLALYGSTAAGAVDAFKAAAFTWGVLIVCAVGGVAGWRAFARLEASDGPQKDVQVLSWNARAAGSEDRGSAWSEDPALRMRPAADADVGAAAAERAHPVVLLVAKELRLQQLTFVVAALYTVLALAAASIEWTSPGSARVPLGAFTGLYVFVLALLAGALASAEERQFGTLEWQLLLPMGASRQWALKAGVALACALLLGTGLPLLIGAAHPGAAGAFHVPSALGLSALVVFLTCCSLFVSSWSTSGVRALVSSLALMFGLLMFGSLTTGMLSALALALPRLTSIAGDGATYRTLLSLLPFAIVACLSAVFLRLGLGNHRSAHPRATGVVGQLAVILALIAGSVLLLSLVEIAATPSR